MRAIVLYDSAYGNTARVADAILGGLRATMQASSHLVTDRPLPALDDVDVLIVGSPTQRLSATPYLVDALDALDATRLRGLPVAAFDTGYHRAAWRSGSAARLIDRHLRALGGRPIVRPERFHVGGKEGPLLPGELHRAVRWGQTLGIRCAEARASVRTR